MKYNLIKATILIKNIKVKTKAEKFVQAKWETLPQKVRQGSKNSEPDGAITNSEAGSGAIEETKAEKEDSWLKGLVWSSINPIFLTWLS